MFATVEVGTVWENYENIGKENNRGDLQKTVEASNALFLILSQDAQTVIKQGDLDFLKSDFVKGKDVFVFEHCEDIKRISIKIPRVSHYFSMYISNAWMVEVIASASAFETPAPKPILLPEVKLDRLGLERMRVLFSPATGQALFDLSTTRPAAKKVLCPECAAAYAVHAPADMRILRCPVCGQFCEMKISVTAGAPIDEAVPA